MANRFCSACGAPLDAGSRFCAECAHPVGEATASEPAPTSRAAGGVLGGLKRRNLLLAGIGLALVVALAVGITLFLNRPSGQHGELFLESATSTGADPFTDSTVTGTTRTTTTAMPTSPTTTASQPPAEGTTVVGTVDGNTAGLYGGTMSEASCDREKQIAFLQANPDKAAAFASVLGISTHQIPEYLRGLTPVVLRHDTRVTNHGFVDGAATSFQSVLQAGTAVLVDKHGIPRVRCMCGNPLLPPTAIEGDVRYQGQTWPGFALDQTIVINNNVDIDIDIDIFILVDTVTGDWFDRPTGTGGTEDKPHDGSDGTTTGGGGLAMCADTYEGAVNRLLASRRSNDRAGASICGSPVVLDYLWRLSNDFVGALKIDHCDKGNSGQLPANIQGYACTMSNNSVFVVELVPQGPTNWIVSYVALVDGGTSTNRPPATESQCGSSAESLSPTTSDERLLVSYFTAINDQDYATAWNLLGDELRSGYGSQQEFADLMAQHLSCVRVLDIKARGGQVYQLQFAAQYIIPFPAGSGVLQEFWTVSGGKIVGAATGP